MSFLKFLKNPKYLLYEISKKIINRYENYSYNFELNGELNLIKKLSSEKFNIIFDVGCNIGNWSKIVLKNIQNTNIHCFDISKKNLELVDKLDDKGRIKINNFGLYNENKNIEYFDFGETSEGNTLLTKSNYRESKTKIKKSCKVLTGNEYCKINNLKNIDFLKIDVEGVEYQVLEGFSELISNKSIKIIQFEYGYLNGDSNRLIRDFYKLLGNNYIIGPLKSTGVLFTNFKYKLNDFKSGPNYVAVLKTETKLIKKLSGRSIEGYINLN